MKRPGEYQLDEPDIVRFSTEFQSALDEFQRTYGFPGATASYVLKDRTTFVAAKRGLQAVPISPDDPNAHYGLGVGIYRSSPFGPRNGHGGWIPGYSSSLRHYADHGVTVAFQINTDIGIVDDTTTVVTEMEKRLAQIAIAANNSMHTDGNSATLHSRQ